MSLKILIFPLCIIMTLTLIIGYIKPDIGSILAMRDEIAKKNTDLGRIETLLANVHRLNAQIDGRHEGESFVLKYVPQTVDQEHMVDIFNFLASQSGVVISGVTAAENEPKARVEPVVEHASVSFQALAPKPIDTGAPAAPTQTIQSYTATVSATGTYDSIKDFLERIYRVDRMHELSNFAVFQREKDAAAAAQGTEPKIPDNFLKVTFEANFPHFALTRPQSPLDLPVFQGDTFDFSTVEDLVNLVTNPLPPLDTGTTGKPNPFQL